MIILTGLSVRKIYNPPGIQLFHSNVLTKYLKHKKKLRMS